MRRSRRWWGREVEGGEVETTTFGDPTHCRMDIAATSAVGENESVRRSNMPTIVMSRETVAHEYASRSVHVRRVRPAFGNLRGLDSGKAIAGDGPARQMASAECPRPGADRACEADLDFPGPSVGKRRGSRSAGLALLLRQTAAGVRRERSPDDGRSRADVSRVRERSLRRLQLALGTGRLRGTTSREKSGTRFEAKIFDARDAR